MGPEESGAVFHHRHGGGTALERGFRLHEEFQRAFVYKPGFEAWVDSVNASATNLPQNQAADGI